MLFSYLFYFVNSKLASNQLFSKVKIIFVSILFQLLSKISRENQSPFFIIIQV